jgi:large subunit ribosomal protein LX
MEGGFNLKAYRVKGTFKMGDFKSPFNREIEAKEQKDAREKILSLLGSEHRCKRQYIKIDAIVELTLDEIEDPLIRARVTG